MSRKDDSLNHKEKVTPCPQSQTQRQSRRRQREEHRSKHAEWAWLSTGVLIDAPAPAMCPFRLS